jgi:hypothetical protein
MDAEHTKEGQAAVAQLGERQTEDLEVPCSIHGRGKEGRGMIRNGLWNAMPQLLSRVLVERWSGEAHGCGAYKTGPGRGSSVRRSPD